MTQKNENEESSVDEDVSSDCDGEDEDDMHRSE